MCKAKGSKVIKVQNLSVLMKSVHILNKGENNGELLKTLAITPVPVWTNSAGVI